jgi:hypothetical protein
VALVGEGRRLEQSIPDSCRLQGPVSAKDRSVALGALNLGLDEKGLHKIAHIPAMPQDYGLSIIEVALG